MDRKQLAIENFKTMNCNQAVLATLGPELGLSEELCLSVGLSFGGGMGREGKTCGAVTGAYVVIGLWSSKQSPNLQEQKKIAAEKVKEFNRAFIEKNKSIECKSLLNYDLSILEEAEKANKMGLFNTLCPVFVAHSVKVLEELLKD
jgi:C_GCAxxG_C_C family probable redox protein